MSEYTPTNEDLDGQSRYGANVYDRAVATELLAARAKLRELAERPLREGDEVICTDSNQTFEWTSWRGNLVHWKRIVRIDVPIPSAAAPPAEVKDGAFVFASEAERQQHLHEVQEAHDFMRKRGGLDETMRGLPAPPRQPEKDAEAMDRLRVAAMSADELARRILACDDDWKAAPLPAEPAGADMDHKGDALPYATAMEAGMAVSQPAARLEYLMATHAREIDHHRAALRAIVETSSDIESVRRAAMALIGGGA